MSIRQKLFDAAFQLVWVRGEYKVSKPNIDTQTVYPASVVDELMREVVTKESALAQVETALRLRRSGMPDDAIVALIEENINMLAKVGL